MRAAARFGSVTVLLLFGMAVTAGSEALAAAWAVWEMDAQAPAVGGAVVASRGSPAAIFFNPAGIAGGDGQRLSVSLTGIQPFTKFSGHGSPNPGPGSEFGVNESITDRLFLLPQLYYTHPVNEGLTLGLGFYTPYGLGVEWEDPIGFSGRHIATRSDMKTYFFSGAVAWQIRPRLTVGAVVDMVTASVQLDQAVVEGFEDGSGEFFHELGTARIAGDTGAQFSAGFGFIADLDERTQVGLGVRTAVDLEFSGDATFAPHEDYEGALPARSTGSTTMPLPAIVGLGIARQLTESLRVEFDFHWIRWSAFDTLTLHFGDEDLPDRHIPENFSDGRMFGLGLEYRQSPALLLRAGLTRDESPQPTASCGPTLPDADRSVLAVGAGYRIGERLTVDVYELMIFTEARRVRDSYDDYNGDYRSFGNVFGLGLNYEW